jgi:hypothetical protein
MLTECNVTQPGFEYSLIGNAIEVPQMGSRAEISPKLAGLESKVGRGFIFSVSFPFHLEEV